MRFKQLLLIFLMSIMFCSTCSNASCFAQEERELLQANDVSRIMQQILDQHIDKKEMSGAILQNAFRTYIEQFDPERIYLLQSEVTPWINLSDEDLKAIEDQYKANDFSAFSRLNNQMQKSIFRAREIRRKIQAMQVPKLFKQAEEKKRLKTAEKHTHQSHEQFVKTPEELYQRNLEQLRLYIEEVVNRYNSIVVNGKQTQIVALYETDLRNNENNYLFRDELGHPLSGPFKENLFILHILKALTGSLDAHTTFYNQSEAYDMRVRLEKGFHGTGLVVKKTSTGIFIDKIMENSPAAKNNNIQLNDRLVKINGKDVSDLPFEDVMEQVEGKEGQDVTLLITHNHSEEGSFLPQISSPENPTTPTIDPNAIEVTLTPALIILNEGRVETYYEKYKNGVIGLIKLHSFYKGEDGITSERDVRNALSQLNEIGKLQGLILDLRDNSGGFLTQAVKVAGLFITNGIIVISKYSNGEERYYRDMDGKTSYNGPLIVLTSKTTASAAEIVAQALQDYGVALVVGDEHTYGKGTIQSQTITDSHATSYFKVTVGKYYTVSGKTPQIYGVKSDIVVPGPYNDEDIGEEYLDYPVEQNDIIPDAYVDTLQDIDPGLKPWYLRYYMPTLQKRKEQWQSMLPTLRSSSEKRITSNKEYQNFLKNAKITQESGEDIDKHGDNIDSDLQIKEAVNIVKDMIDLQQQRYKKRNASEEKRLPHPSFSRK